MENVRELNVEASARLRMRGKVYEITIPRKLVREHNLKPGQILVLKIVRVYEIE